MLRMYFLKQWFGLSDEGLEDTIYDSQAFRTFLEIDLGRESVPDATTLLKFRRLLEDKDLARSLFDTVNRTLRERGLLLEKGTMVDATIVAAPASTKNKDQARAPEMGQTCKGKQWHFGAKAHIGADADSGLVHSVEFTAANVADVTQTAELLHGKETRVHADAGYTGVQKREEAKIRSRVEHPFHIVKNLFRQRKLRYRGLAKNGTHWRVLFALANLVIAKKVLLA